MKRIVLVSLTAIIAVSLLLAACSSKPAATPSPTTAPTPASPSPTASPAVKPIMIKVAGTSEKGYIITQELEKGMELIKQRSGGRIDFEYHPSGSLYNLEQSSKAIMDDVIPMGNFKGGYFQDRLGVACEQANMPYNYPFAGFVANARTPGGFFEWISPYYEKNNVKLLSYPVAGPVDIMSKKPLRKVEDVKGTLMRTVAGAAATAFKLLGAEPVFLSTGEIYEGLARGTIDGTNSSASSCYTRKYYEVVKYFTVGEFTNAGIEIAMSLKAFKALPADLQKIVMDTFLEVERDVVFKNALASYEKDLENLKSKGVEIIRLDKPEIARWRANVAPMYDDLAKKYGEEWKAFMKVTDPMWK